MGKKTISNSFTVNIVEDGESAPYYFEEWYAWSNDTSTASVTTEPTIDGTWQQSIPAQGDFAYLWRKSVRWVWNASTKTYTDENAQYFRMSGTNGTSISTKGSVVDYVSSPPNFRTDANDGDKGICAGIGYLYTYSASQQTWVVSQTPVSDGYAYTLQYEGHNKNGHLLQWSDEGGDWIDLGQFKGDSGKTYYSHFVYATKVNYSGTTVTSIEGYTPTKSPNDTTHFWMGTYVDENSADPTSGSDPILLSYTWSYTRGNDGTSPYIIDIDNEMFSVACDENGKPSASGSKVINVKMWKGSTLLSPSITCTTVSQTGVTNTVSQLDKTVTFSWSNETAIGANNTWTITTVADGITLSTTFQLNGVRAGAKGESATVYELIPSVNQIVKKKDGSYTPSANTYITCAVTKNVGGTQSTPASSEYTLKYKLNGGAETIYTSTSIKASNVTSNIQFILYDKSSTPKKMDVETIPLVSDGNDGEDAYSVETNPTTVSIECDANGNVLSNDYVTVLPKMYKGSTLVSSTLSNINGNKLVAVAGSSSEGIRIYGRLRVWKASGGGEVYTINEYPNVQVGETAYRWSTGDILVPYGTVTATGTVYIVVNSTRFDRVSSGTKIVNLTTPTTLSFTITSGGVSRNVEMQITGNKVGAQGKMSRNLYFAGMLSDIGGNTFTATDHKAPYVDVETGTSPLTPTCYMYVGANGTNITFPATAAAYQSSSDWELMWSDYTYLITQAVFAEFAKLGSWIFNGDYMFSQTGVDGTTNYEDFEGESGAWQPNLYMNALTGRLVANDIVLRGVINNMINKLTPINYNNFGCKYGNTLYINPLKCGQYVEFDVNSQSLSLVLPSYAYGMNLPIKSEVENEDIGEIEYTYYSINELRQMVEKSIVFMPKNQGASAPSLTSAILFERQYLYNDLNSVTRTAGYYDIQRINSLSFAAQSQSYFIHAHCMTGVYNSRECIYWEVEAIAAVLESPIIVGVTNDSTQYTTHTLELENKLEEKVLDRNAVNIVTQTNGYFYINCPKAYTPHIKYNDTELTTTRLAQGNYLDTYVYRVSSYSGERDLLVTFT